MNVRQAKTEDIQILQQLNEELFIDNQQYDPDLRMDWSKGEEGNKYFAWLLNEPMAGCFIAEEKGKSVGYIAVGPKNATYRKSKYVEIHNMGVTPKYRSKGIGSLLIKKSLEWAKIKGYNGIIVQSYFKNFKAVSFYKNNGFSETEITLERNI